MTNQANVKSASQYKRSSNQWHLLGDDAAESIHGEQRIARVIPARPPPPRAGMHDMDVVKSLVWTDISLLGFFGKICITQVRK